MRAKRIKTIEDMAEKKQQDAALLMQQAKNQWQQQQQQLESLLRYRLEYQQKQKQQTPSANHVQFLKEYKSFLDKISKAIEQQKQVVQQFEQAYRQQQQLWIVEKKKATALTKVRESLEAQKKQQEAMLEQKLMDEFANNRFHRK